MSENLIISNKTIDIFKKQVSKRMSDTGQKRTTCLENLAKELGFSNWQQIISIHKETLDFETRLLNGCFIIMDSKNSESANFNKIGYKEAYDGKDAGLMIPYIISVLNFPKHTWNNILLDRWDEIDDDLDDVGYTFDDLRIFYNENEDVPNLAALLDKIGQVSTFAPEMVWIQNRFHDLTQSIEVKMGDKLLLKVI